MAEPIETRRLAAVMFADIEGYTSMFQRNEVEALAQIKLHREHLQAITGQYHGQIIKYYGDGSLTVFNSLIEAVKCAADVQRISAEHHIPLRIGIHMGEMLERENDIYGDAVNVASRIQAVGVPGSILVSKIVADEIKNHPDLQTKSIGHFKLKNVKTSTEVFAVSGTGIPFPLMPPNAPTSRFRKKYLFIAIPVLLLLAALFWSDTARKKFGFKDTDCIIIPPFTSFVTNPDFQHFPELISSLLSKRMAESTDVDIVSPISASYYTNADMASIAVNPAMARNLGAKYVIQGNFTLEGSNEETLRVWMSIVDSRTGKSLPIKIPDITCNAADRMVCIQHASDVLAGYWKSYKDYLFQFTNDSAYIAFAIAQEKWADPGSDSLVKSQLLKAIGYDPQFLDAWFLLLDFFHNRRDISSGLDTLNVIRKKFPSMTPRQQDYLGYYEYDFKSKNLLAFQSFYKEYKKNEKDLFINTTGMVMAQEYLNNPTLALQFFHQIDPDRIDLAQCTYCLTRFNLALKAYMDLNNMDQAKAMSKRLQPYAVKRPHFIELIAYYIKTGDTLSVNDVIQKAAKVLTHPDEEQFFLLTAARIASVQGNVNLRNVYAQKVIRLPGDHSASTLGRCYMLLENWKEAERIFLAEIKKKPTQSRAYAFLGVVYARQGKKEAADQMIQKLDELKPEIDFGVTAYQQGRIKANELEFQEALQYLKTAFDEGIRFYPYETFIQDPDMTVINSNKEYLDLLAGFRQYKFE